eukprot:6634937-Pyramimonas_sp.AAC.1
MRAYTANVSGAVVVAHIGPQHFGYSTSPGKSSTCWRRAKGSTELLNSLASALKDALVGGRRPGVEGGAFTRLKCCTAATFNGK